MITFKSKSEAIRNADKITRAANLIYPHLSESKSRISVRKFQAKHYPDPRCFKYSNLSFKYSTKLDNLRYRKGDGIDLFRNVIDMLKNNKIGNCYEEAVLAQIIGKINGVKNIYTSKIFFNKNSSGYQTQLDHVVSIITDKPFEKDYKYSFKNNDAIVIDPWLGITEFVGDYVRRLKTNFIDTFPTIPDFKYSFKGLKEITNNIGQFKQERKKIFKPDFSFMLHSDETLPEQYVTILKEEFPELIFKKK